MIPRFLKRFDIDYFLIAMPYTLLDQETLEGELQLCFERSVKIIIGAVFASGILATGATSSAQYRYQPAPAEIRNKVNQLQATCDRHDINLSAAALQFPLAHPAVAAVIPGANSPQQVEQNLSAFKTTIPAAFWSDLRNEELLHPAAPVPTKTS